MSKTFDYSVFIEEDLVNYDDVNLSNVKSEIYADLSQLECQDDCEVDRSKINLAKSCIFRINKEIEKRAARSEAEIILVSSDVIEKKDVNKINTVRLNGIEIDETSLSWSDVYSRPKLRSDGRLEVKFRCINLDEKEFLENNGYELPFWSELLSEQSMINNVDFSIGTTSEDGVFLSAGIFEVDGVRIKTFGFNNEMSIEKTFM